MEVKREPAEFFDAHIPNPLRAARGRHINNTPPDSNYYAITEYPAERNYNK